MKKSKIILLTLLSSCLFACDSKNINSSESKDNGSSSVEDSIEDVLPDNYSSSVKNYLKALKTIHNYSISETVSSTAATYENYIQMKYTKSYYYYDFGTYTNGYIESKDGVYQISLKDDSLVGGEIVRDSDGNAYKNLWETNLFKNFSTLDDTQLDSLEDGKTDVSIKGKQNKLTLLTIFGLNSSYYGEITSFKASIGSNNELSFALELNDATSGTINVDAIVYGLLTSKSQEVESFINNGGTYYVIDSDFAKARTLMKANNYTHNYYYEKKVVGIEYFNENYYFVNWDTNYVKETEQLLYSQGLIGLDHKKDSNGNIYTGSYLITLSNNNTLAVSLSRPYNESPNIPYVYHYPSYLDMWSNPEFFDQDETPEDLDVYLTTTDALIMNNFIENFSMSNQVANVNIRSLSIGWKDIEDDDNSSRIIRFCLSTSGGDVTYDFSNFGTTKITALDNFLNQFVD